jgi:hypothetical protein
MMTRIKILMTMTRMKILIHLNLRANQTQICVVSGVVLGYSDDCEIEVGLVEGSTKTVTVHLDEEEEHITHVSQHADKLGITLCWHPILCCGPSRPRVYLSQWQDVWSIR